MKTLLKSLNVFTGSGMPKPLGILVNGNVIEKLFSYDETPENVQVMDFKDKFLMPGFIDAHTHFFSGAVTASDYVCTEIRNAVSEEECVKMLIKFRTKHPKCQILRGEGWFIGNWSDRRLPDKRSLDKAFPDMPVYLRCADGHSYWLNSAALRQCKIDAQMTPKSGYIGKFDNGELSGLLVEPEAYAPADMIYYSFNKKQQEEIYKKFFELTASYGITGMSEMFADDYTDPVMEKYDILKDLDSQGKAGARVYIYTKLFDYKDFGKALEWKKHYDTPHVLIAGVKGFVDGVAEMYTGMLLEPYSDKPETCGIGVPLRPYEDMKKSVASANKAGLQVRLHCIGDGAVRMALDIYEGVAKEQKIHNTIEHIETIHPNDIGRFKKLGVIPSMQPEHLALDNNNKVVRLGKERAKYEWCLKTMYEATDMLAIGTDYPVIQINPFKNIYCAVTRNGFDGKPTGCNPEEKLTMEQVLTGYTRNAAKAYGSVTTGMIKAGMAADIIAIDRNLFEIPKREIPDSKVIFTMFDGKIIYGNC